MSFLILLEESEKQLDNVIAEVAIKRKRVIRGGKLIKKKDCPKGYKKVGNRCVKMSSSERLTRKRAGRKAGRKGKAARRRQFKRSIKKRRTRKLKRVSF